MLLKNLNLMTDDNKLRNSAILLFGKKPLKHFVSASFRIGRFGIEDHDLRFHDIIEGNIFEMPNKVMEVLKAKYLIAPISYEGLQRIEELEYPEKALREAILNAIVHKDYIGVHIQMSVYDNKIILWNQGVLPESITNDTLKKKHSSHPRNKNIADVFLELDILKFGVGESIKY